MNSTFPVFDSVFSCFFFPIKSRAKPINATNTLPDIITTPIPNINKVRPKICFVVIAFFYLWIYIKITAVNLGNAKRMEKLNYGIECEWNSIYCH